MTSFTQFQGREYPAADAPFDVNRTMGPQPFFRDVLDERRSMWRFTPEAMYPDGYLGTLNSRRADRLMENLIDRSRNRPYTRGIHKGERIEGRDYFWPEEFNPETGLLLESMGERFAPVGMAGWDDRPTWDNPVIGERMVPRQRIPRGLPRGGTVAWGAASPATRQGLAKQAPPWISGGAQMGTPYPGVGRM
jgi:hypothetical protein